MSAIRHEEASNNSYFTAVIITITISSNVIGALTAVFCIN